MQPSHVPIRGSVRLSSHLDVPLVANDSRDRPTAATGYSADLCPQRVFATVQLAPAPLDPDPLPARAAIRGRLTTSPRLVPALHAHSILA